MPIRRSKKFVPPSRKPSSFKKGTFARRAAEGKLAITIKSKKRGRRTFVEKNGKPTLVLEEKAVKKKPLQRRATSRKTLVVTEKGAPKFKKGIEQERKRVITERRARLIQTASKLRDQGFILKEKGDGFQAVDVRKKSDKLTEKQFKAEQERFKKQEEILRKSAEKEKKITKPERAFFKTAAGIKVAPAEQIKGTKAESLASSGIVRGFISKKEARPLADIRPSREAKITAGLRDEADPRSAFQKRFLPTKEVAAERKEALAAKVQPFIEFEEKITRATTKKIIPERAVRRLEQIPSAGPGEISPRFAVGIIKTVRDRPVTLAITSVIGAGLGGLGTFGAATGGVGGAAAVGTAKGVGLGLAVVGIPSAGFRIATAPSKPEALGELVTFAGAGALGAKAGGFVAQQLVKARLAPKITEIKFKGERATRPTGEEGIRGVIEAKVIQRETLFGKPKVTSQRAVVDLLSGRPGLSQQKVFAGRIISKTQTADVLAATQPGKAGLRTKAALTFPKKSRIPAVEVQAFSKSVTGERILGTKVGKEIAQAILKPKVGESLFVSDQASFSGKNIFRVREKGIIRELIVTPKGKVEFIKSTLLPTKTAKDVRFKLPSVGKKGQIRLAGDARLGVAQRQIISPSTLVRGRPAIPLASIGKTFLQSSLSKTPVAQFGVSPLFGVGVAEISAFARQSAQKRRSVQATSKKRLLDRATRNIQQLSTEPIQASRLLRSTKQSQRGKLVQRTTTVTKTITEPTVLGVTPPSLFAVTKVPAFIPPKILKSERARKKKGKGKKPKKPGRFTQTLFGVEKGAKARGKRKLFTGFELIRL